MKAEKSGFEKEPIKSGRYPGYCFGVIGIGNVKTQYGLMPFVRLLFELPTLRWTDPEDPTRTGVRQVSERFPLKLGNITRPSGLATFLQQWRGKAWNAADYDTFELENILGAPVCLTIEAQTNSRGTTYNTITSAAPTLKRKDNGSRYIIGSIPSEEIDLPEMVNDKVFFDPQCIDPAALEKVPAWVKRELVKNGVIQEQRDDQHVDDRQYGVEQPQQQYNSNQPNPHDDDEELPF